MWVKLIWVMPCTTKYIFLIIFVTRILGRKILFFLNQTNDQKWEVLGSHHAMPSPLSKSLIVRGHSAPLIISNGEIAQMVEWAFVKYFSSGPEFQSWIGRVFLQYWKTIISSHNDNPTVGTFIKEATRNPQLRERKGI